MALTPVDKELLTRCLRKQPGSWNDFVDRYLSLIYHVIHYTAHLRSARLMPEDVEDIAAEVMLEIIKDDYKALRQFKGTSNLATYLTVIARRTCVHELTRRQNVKDAINRGDVRPSQHGIQLPDEESEAVQKSMDSLEEVDRLLRKLSGKPREIVRLFYLEGRTYEEISTETGVPVNSIGAVLTRARAKLREYRKSSTSIPALTAHEIKASKARREMKTGEA